MDTSTTVDDVNEFSREVLNFHRQLITFQQSKKALLASVLVVLLCVVDIWLDHYFSMGFFSYLFGWKMPTAVKTALLIINVINIGIACCQYLKIQIASRNICLSKDQKQMFNMDKTLGKACPETSSRVISPGRSASSSLSSRKLPKKQLVHLPLTKLSLTSRTFATASYPSSTTVLARQAFSRALNTLRKAHTHNSMKDGHFIRTKEQMKQEWTKCAKSVRRLPKMASPDEFVDSANSGSTTLSPSGSSSCKVSNSWIFTETQKSRQWMTDYNESSFLSSNDSKESPEKHNFAAYIATKPVNLKSPQNDMKPCTFEKTLEILKVTAAQLDRMSDNFRLWMHVTILKPLVEEVDRANAKLAELSKSTRIGESSISTLQSLLISKNDNLTTLPTILRYVELCSNQEYIVKRLRQLAKDGAISEYKWDGGMDMSGKAWDEHLPTDTEILFHVFCTFVDNHLPANPLCMDGRTFSTELAYRFPNVPKPIGSSSFIYRASTNPPHFQLLIGNQWHDVGKGRRNFLYSMVLFLQALKINRSGFLEEISLGPSGLNLLWVLK